MFGKKKLTKEEKKAAKKAPTELSGYLSNYKVVNGMSVVLIIALVLIALGIGTNYGGDALWITGLVLICIFGFMLAFLLLFQVKNDKRILEIKKEQETYNQKMRIINKQIVADEKQEEMEIERWKQIEEKAKKRQK